MENFVVLFCSKNLNGHTAKLLNFHLNKLKFLYGNFNYKQINLYDYYVLPCDGCLTCVKEKKCPKNTKDDFLKLVYLIKKSNRLILASNVFFSGYGSKLKAFIDRCEQFYCAKIFGICKNKIKNKPADLVLTGGRLNTACLNAILLCTKQFLYCIDFKLKLKLVAPQTDTSGFFYFVK